MFCCKLTTSQIKEDGRATCCSMTRAIEKTKKERRVCTGESFLTVYSGTCEQCGKLIIKLAN